MDRRCTLMDVVRNPVNAVLQRREDKLEQWRKKVGGGVMENLRTYERTNEYTNIRINE